MGFKELGLIEPLLKALETQGYKTPTPIQQQAIGPVLAGKDILGIAQTGTGKTAAFTLPILQHIYGVKKPTMRGHPRALILAPTRELAAQIDQSITEYGQNVRNITHAVIFGGVGQSPQVHALNQGADIVVATPGRLLDLIQQRFVHLENVEILVLDEADRMLDMGFIKDVKRIISLVPRRRQTLFFSATMPAEVSSLAHSILSSPIRVEVTPQATTVERIKQQVLFVDKEQKQDVLLQLLSQEHLNRVLVFTRTKHAANKVAKMLSKNKIYTDAIHGNKSQNARVQALANFKSGRTRVLVATDIAARGIDIEGISHVINYELPNEPESYVHRIGRTARAGTEGVAYSLCCAEEREYLNNIEKVIRQRIPVLKHELHSEAASNARGAAARPPPKQFGQQRRNGPKKNHGMRGMGIGEREDSGRRKPKYGESGRFNKYKRN